MEISAAPLDAVESRRNPTQQTWMAMFAIPRVKEGATVPSKRGVGALGPKNIRGVLQKVKRFEGEANHMLDDRGGGTDVNQKLPSGQIQLFCAFSDQYGNAATAGIKSAKLSIQTKKAAPVTQA